MMNYMTEFEIGTEEAKAILVIGEVRYPIVLHILPFPPPSIPLVRRLTGRTKKKKKKVILDFESS